MIANSSLITYGLSDFEIGQLYNSPSLKLNDIYASSLYAFLSFKDDWNEEILTSKVAQTVIKTKSAVAKGSNVISILDENSLINFFPGQTIVSPHFSINTKIVSLNEETMEITVDNNSTNNYIGLITYKGLNQINLITIDETTASTEISDIDNFYVGCSILIDVENSVGGLQYTRSIIAYDADTRTLKLDKPLNDFPPLSLNSTLTLFYDNLHPPIPKDSVKYLKQVYKDMYYMKKINSNDICPVVERINWSYGTIYDYYRDDVSMTEKDSNGNLKRHFYIMNSFFQVFKCMWNNNGAQSKEEPYFVSGKFDYALNIFYSEIDGYKWKYLYTVSGDKIQKFLSDKYMPVEISQAIDLTTDAVGCGGIEVINVIDQGSDYNDLYHPITITIIGDGTGAVARASVDRTANTIKDIVLTTAGKNYTYAEVVITSDSGNNCIAIPSISPPGGTGTNLITELGCNKAMIACLFSPSEDLRIPTDMQMRQFGIISNPQDVNSRPNPANTAYYVVSSIVTVSPGFNAFQRGETVYQVKNKLGLTNAYYTATVADFAEGSNALQLVNESGIPSLNSSLYGNSSGTVRTFLGRLESNIVKHTGNIIYVQNVEEIQRNEDSIELFKVILQF